MPAQPRPRVGGPVRHGDVDQPPVRSEPCARLDDAVRIVDMLENMLDVEKVEAFVGLDALDG